MKTIGENAFYGCTSLSTLVIPSGVTSIGRNAFKGCTSLTSLTIPESVTDIDTYGLEWGRDCPGLTIYCNKNSAAHQYAQRFEIRFELLDGEADTSTPVIQSAALTKNGQTVDLLTTPQSYTQSSEETATVSVSVDWDGIENGRVFLLQDRDTYVELTSQATSFAPGSIFAPGQQIYVIATNADASELLDWKETKLQIVQASPPDAPQIFISPESLSLSIGKTENVTVTTTPAGARHTLTSSDPEVVSVSGNTLTAHKLGRVEITAALADYPDVQAVCSVAVKEGYDDLMCAIAASQLAYEDELVHYDFGASVETFADDAIGPDRNLWNWAVWDAPLSDFYKDVLGDWKIVNVVSEPSGLFAVALDNA
ncbi:leucine-rich repeat protein, partial [Oscillibacter sp. CU971]|uniref:leucine-rich repeat protein n=1 Tax=Oscillibacter sp. CU971 TaxID=2780102 RepID=UPI00195CAA3A